MLMMACSPISGSDPVRLSGAALAAVIRAPFVSWANVPNVRYVIPGGNVPVPNIDGPLGGTVPENVSSKTILLLLSLVTSN